MRLDIAWLLMPSCVFAQNTPSFTYTLAGSSAGAIATDAAGNTYIAGGANGGIVSTPGAFQPQDNSSGICQFVPMVGAGIPCYGSFIEKLDASGNVVFATFFGGNGNTAISGIAVDQRGNIYVAGTTSPPVGGVNTFPVTVGAAFVTQPAGAQAGTAGFISKLDSSGSQLIYSTFFPAAVTALAMDAAGNAYVTGYGSPPSFPATPGAFQTMPKSGNNVSPGIVAKLNASGTAASYATYVSGSGAPNGQGGDYPASIAVDAAGDAFITGWTNSADFPVTPGAFLTTYPGERSVFLTKVNPQGTGLVFSTYLGPTAYAPAVKLDTQGTAFVAGSTASMNFPTTAGATPFSAGLSATGSGSVTPISGFLTHFSLDGSSLIYSTFVGAVGYSSAALDVDGVGNAVFAGVTSNAALPVGAAAFQSLYAGGAADAYVARFTPDGRLSGGTYLGGSLKDSPSSIAFGPNGSVVVAGNTQSSNFPGIAQPVASGGVDFVTSIFPSLTVLNAASYIASGIAPGEIVALKGYGMGPVNGVIASGASLPTALGGASISFDGFPAPLLYVQAEQINAQVPWEIAAQSLTALTSIFPTQPQQTTTLVVVAPSLPGIFHVNNSDGTQNSPSNPAHPGDLISLYGTGGGSASPPGMTGQFWGLPAPLSSLTLPVSVVLNGENAAVVYAGSAPTLESGIFQINALVPADAAASAAGSIAVIIGGTTSVAVSMAIAAH
jgi:uncharacterized protein (TIGR03437 family)